MFHILWLMIKTHGCFNFICCFSKCIVDEWWSHREHWYTTPRCLDSICLFRVATWFELYSQSLHLYLIDPSMFICLSTRDWINSKLNYIYLLYILQFMIFVIMGLKASLRSKVLITRITDITRQYVLSFNMSFKCAKMTWCIITIFAIPSGSISVIEFWANFRSNHLINTRV